MILIKKEFLKNRCLQAGKLQIETLYCFFACVSDKDFYEASVADGFYVPSIFVMGGGL